MLNVLPAYKIELYPELCNTKWFPFFETIAAFQNVTSSPSKSNSSDQYSMSVSVLLVIAMAVTVFGCGKSGAVGDSAAIREFDPNDDTVYFAEQYIPLSSSNNCSLVSTK